MSQSSVSHYAKGSVANIVRSLLVIGAITAALFFLISRTSSVTAEQVDAAAGVDLCRLFQRVHPVCRGRDEDVGGRPFLDLAR